MGRTYFNHGITGNGKMLATFTDKGELNRIFWPEPDFYQQINCISVGIKFDDSETRFLNENVWYTEQSYDGDSAILNTLFENSDYGLRINQQDFVLQDSDTLVRKYSIKNISDRELNIRTFLHTDFVTDQMNIRSGMIDFENNVAVIYNKLTAVAIGSQSKISKFQFGDDAKNAAKYDTLFGKDSISMTSDMGVKWELGICKPGETLEFNLYFCFANSINDSVKIFCDVVKEDVNSIYKNVKKYWKEFFKKLNSCSVGNEKIDDIYMKSLMVFKLFSNADTGAILAAAEIDENFSRCGRYGYCWPRDGVFIVKAFDICGMNDLAEKFFTVWAKNTQLSNGAWQQRYFLDGKLAPSWGIQIDEIASLIYGIKEHYESNRKYSFLEEMWPTVKSGLEFLINNIDEETGLPKASYDLWEERIGEHTYSAGSVVGALNAGIYIANELEIVEPFADIWREKSEKIKKAIEEQLWNKDEKRFYRGIKTRLNWWNCGTSEIELNQLGDKLEVASIDSTVDISILGLAVPFNVFDIKDEKIKKTVRDIEERLDGFPSGGYGRYEYDSYIGGNPWIISTLWLALYYLEAGEIEKGKELFVWAVKHTTNLGFLPEQIDKFSGEPAWVMQLAWSHAMFIIVLDKLKKISKEALNG
ncbi:MAG: glycoside hydrolase [Clostridiales bacterium]|nr:glycoside hydrolase [Clostridiales bacterium]